MELFSVFAAILAVCAYSAFFVLRMNTASGASPLAVLCGAVLWFCGWGYIGMLHAGGALWYAGAAAALAFAILGAKKTGWKKSFETLFSPGFVLFVCGGVFFGLLLFIRRPLFTFWDEFSFWGTASKLTKLHNTLYPAVESSFAGKLAYPPAVPLLSYIAGFFAPAFRDWIAMAGYDMMLCACLGAVISAFGHKQRRIGLFAGVSCLLIPMLFETSALAGGLCFAWRTLLSELMLGCLFGGALAVWFAAKQKNADTALRFALVLAVLGLTKEAGFVLTLAAVMIAGLDLLIFERKSFTFGKLHGWAAVGAALLLVVLVALPAYPGWNFYFAKVTAIDRTAADGAAGLSMAGIVISGLRELAGIGRTEHFSLIFGRMVSAYFTKRVSILGTGFAVTVLIFSLCALAFFLRPAGKRGAAALYFGTGVLGLAGMMLFNLFAYAYVFDAASGEALIDYTRYMGFYYHGWLLGALAVLFPALGHGRKRLCMPAITAVLCAFCICFVPFSRTLFAPGIAQSDARQTIRLRAQEAKETCAEQDRIFLVSQFDDAGRWYQYAHELEPLRVLPMLGGTLTLPGNEMGTAPAQKEITPEELRCWLCENGCTYVLIDQAGEYDSQGYAQLFTDHLAEYEQNGVRLYRAAEKDGLYCLEPCGKAGMRG